MEPTKLDIYRLVFKEYPDVLDIKQIADILGICEKTVYKLISEDSLQSMKIGRRYKVTKLAVLQYLKIIDNNFPETEANI